jgi:Domain of unknown function (DUF927)
MDETRSGLGLRFKLTRIFVAGVTPDAGAVAFEFSFGVLPHGRNTAILTLAQIDNVPDLRKALGERGFSASAAGTTFTRVQQVLNNLVKSDRARTVRPWRLAGASGWWGDDFLVQERPVPPDARLVLDPRVKVDADNGPVQTGSAEVWSGCMWRLRHSSAVVAAVCAGLSSPLLPFRRGASAAGLAIAFTGMTTLGKTYATRAAKTVIGHPLHLLPFRASEAGLEWIAQVYRHLPLVLDEPKSTRAGHREAASHVAYLVEGGASAILHPSWQETRSRIETVVITGAETGAFGQRSGGEQVRLAEIPCGPMGPFGIIDQHEQAGISDDAAAKRWLDEELALLAENHGHALPALAGHAASLGGAETTRLVALRTEEFTAYAAECLGPADKAELRVRSAFAFFFAAGALASEAKVVPWSMKRIRGSLLRCLWWHEQLARPEAGGADAGMGAEARRLVTALKRRAHDPGPTSKATLEARGAVHDARAKEIRATDAFLREEAGGKNALERGLAELARGGFVLPGDAPGKRLRQVRYADGRIRVVCFSPAVLGDAAVAAAQPGRSSARARGPT